MGQARYETLDVIGSGGMATVWRARDTVLGRLVAIKRPNPAPEGSTATARFGREARVAATVSHPNLVAVYDTGVDDTGPYLVMELVDGPSLATADVAPERVARIGAEVASALAALHGAGVVHGDVKPGNILLPHGGAKLTDFGVARSADDTMTLTQPGMTFGTPAYAAPETIAHGERSAAGDVYSLAATLHELVTGSRWNDARASTQVMAPGGWSRILPPALSANPAERPSPAAMAESLAALHSGGSPMAATTPMSARGAAPIRPATTATSRDASSARRIAVVAFVAGLALIAAVVALAARDRDGVTNAELPDSITATSSPAAADEPPSSAATSTAAPTTQPAASSTSLAVTTTPPAEPLTSNTPEAVAAELVALIESVPRDELNPNDSNDITKRIDDVLRVARDDPRETDEKLREVAEHIDKHVRQEDTLEAAEELLVELARMLDVDEDALSDARGRRD